MKRFYIIAVMCLVALTGLKPTLQAQTIWNGTADISWYDASQTSFDISTPEQLAGLAQLVNTGTSFSGVSLNLTNDIWLNSTGDSTNNWTPIGGGSPSTAESPSTGNAFKGNFNGHGHSIYNLYCDKGSTFHAGLFCALENPCTIDSLVLVNPVLKSRGMMGCIAGFPRGSSSVYVRYCLVINARIVGENTSGSNNIGGIFGATYPNNGNTYIQNCGVTGSITGYYPGGMSGNAERSYITNAYFAGTLYSYGTNYGGMTAHSGNHTNCYSYTQVLSSITQSSASSDGTAVTQTEMQSANMITLLGDAFKEDNGINNGYPIMSYMAGVDPVAANICLGESVTLTAFGYDSYLWDNGATTESITVSPTATTTYSVSCTSNGVTEVNTSTITVYPQAVITATVVPSADGQTHGTVTPESSTVPCGSSQTVTLTITPDVNWHISRIVQDGVVLREDDPTDGSVVSFVIDPQGTLANVQVYFDNLYNITVSQQLDDGSPISLSNLVSPWGTNGVYAATAGSDQTYTFTSSDRYHVTDVEIDGASQGVISSYTFYGLDQTHSIVVTYVDSCGIFSLPYAENFSNGFSECWYKGSTYSSTYPYISSSRLYFYTSSSTYTYAVLPAVADDLPYQVNELQVTFNAQYSTLNNTLQIGVMSDPTDVSTFMIVDAVSNTATGTMQPHVVYLGAYNGSGKYIAFRWSGTSSGSCYLDDVVVDVAPTCSNVTNLQVSNIYGTNATLTWSPNAMGEAVNYVIEVMEAGDIVTAEYYSTETTYLLAGLNEQTSYTVSVYPDCGGNDYGEAVTVSFTTPCVAPIEVVNNSYPSSTYTTEGNHFPMSNHYLNSFTEQIYYASELNNTSAEFSGMSFQYNLSTVITRTLDIYMAHTYDSAFVQNVWATPADNYVHVYSGPVTFNNTGTDRWVDIAFDTNFYYNGYDNLLLIVNDITGSSVSNSNEKFYTINYSVNRSQCEYNNEANANWSITNLPATGRVKTQVNNIRLTACDVVSCIAPNTVAVGPVDAYSAEISWYNPNASQNCEIEYKADSDADWTSAGTVNGSSYTIYGLDANTQYQARVRAICGSASTSEWSETVTFRTECEAIVTFPYVQNFDSNTYGSGTDAYISCWDRYTTDPSKPVQMYQTSAAHSTPNALRFFDGANVTNIAIMPRVDESISLNQLQVDFWVRSTSSTAPVILELGVMTDKSDPTTFEILDTIPAPYLPNDQYTFVEYSLANYTGYGQYIAFRASKGNGGNNLRLDDVTLDYIPVCQHPVDLAASNVTAETADLTWSELGTASTWYVEYGPVGFTPGDGTTETAYDTAYTISGLNPDTQYDVYVWSDCGGDLVSTTVSTTFRTGCGPISLAMQPWTANFEGGDDPLLNCWYSAATGSRNGHTYPHIEPSSSIAHSGSAALEVAFGDIVTALPLFVEPIETVQMSFWAKSNRWSGQYPIIIGYITDPTDSATFVGLDTLEFNTYTQIDKSFAGLADLYLPSTTRIAFKYDQGSSSNLTSWYIDDMVVSLIPDCAAPDHNSVAVSNMTAYSAEISFTDPDNTHDTWMIFYKEEGSSEDYLTETVQSTSGNVLTGLTPNTTYTMFVVTACNGMEGDDHTNSITFTTTTIPTTLPYNTDFEDDNDNSQWVLLNGTQTNKWYIGVPTDSTSDVNTTVGGVNGLYISKDGGASNTYQSTESRVYAYRDILVPDGTTELQLSFDWKAQGGLYNYEFLRVYWIDPSVVTLTPGNNPPGSYDASAQPGNYGPNATEHWLSQHNSWQHQEMVISADQFEGMGNGDKVYRLVFHWRNSYYSGNPPAAVDNIVLAPVACNMPMNLTVDDVTANSATVSWSGNSDSYGVTVVSNAGVDYQIAYDTTLTLNNLTPNTAYQVTVRGYCGADSSMISQTISFTTACGAFTVAQGNPWTEDFETNTTMSCFDTPIIYTNSNGSTYPKMLLNYSLAAHSGGNSLEFKGDTNMLLLPEFTNDIHDLRMSFWATTWGVTTTAVVGVLSDMNDPASFEALGDAGTPGPRGPNGSTGNGNFMGPFDFNTVQATSGRIAILFSGTTASDAGWNLDDFTVELIPSCSAPVHTSVTVTNVTENSVDISFTDDDPSHNAWVIYYGPTGTATDTWSSVNVTSTVNTLTGLTSNTDYSAYVMTLCGGVEGDDQTNTVSFTTTTVPATLPYTTDFEDAVEDQQWVFVNGTQTNKWYIGVPTDVSSDVNTTVGGTNGLYISNNGGEANTYSSTTSKVYAYRDIFVPDGTTELVLSFDWKAQGSNSHYHFLRVYWLDPSVNLTPGNNPPGYDLSGQPGGEHWLAQQSTWQHQEMVISADQFAGMGVGDRTYRLVFHWRNESYSVSNPPAAVDNIELRAVTCATPTGLYVSNVNENDATVSWTGNADSYGVTITSAAGTDYQTTTTNSLTLTGLNPSTTYQVTVRAFCGGDSSMVSQPVSFTTACGAISVATTPWSTGFEGTDAELLNCWVSASTGYYNGNTFPHITNTSIIAHSGSSALEIAFGDIVTALPLFLEDISSLQVSFWTKHNNYSSDNPTMELGYVTDPYDANSFVSLETMTSSSYTEVTRTFADLAGLNLPSTTRIAFRYTRPTSSSLSSWYVDDIEVSLAGPGPVITNPTVATTAASNVEQNSATLNGTITNPDNVTITSKGFEWKATTGGTYTPVVVTGPALTHDLTGLNPNTSYTYKAFIIYNGQTVYGNEMTFTTLPEDTPEPCDVPTGLTVSAVTDASMTVTWDDNSGVNSWNIQYSAEGGTLNSATSNVNSYTIEGLQPETTYSIQVQANCGDGNLSAWSTSVTGTTTVGIDSWLENSVTLYPNPANEVVNVQCTMYNVQGVEVFDVFGKVVRTVGLPQCDSPTTRINVAGLADGMYFVRVTTDEGTVTKTFVKK